MSLRLGWTRQPVLELATLNVRRHPAGKQLQPSCVVQVQVAERHRFDVVDRDASRIEGAPRSALLHRGGSVGTQPPGRSVDEAPVADQRRVEPGVEQQPASVELEQDAWGRLAKAQMIGGTKLLPGLG